MAQGDDYTQYGSGQDQSPSYIPQPPAHYAQDPKGDNHIILIVCLVVIALGLGGFFAWRFLKPGEATQPQTPISVESFSASATGDQITLTCAGFDGDAELYRAEPYEYGTLDTYKGLGQSREDYGRSEGTINCANGATISRVDESGHDKIYDRYYIVSNGKLAAGPIYVTGLPTPDNTVQLPTQSLKGAMSYRDYDTATLSDLGCSWTSLDLNVASLILPNEDPNGTAISYEGRGDVIPFQSGGKTYYFSSEGVGKLDAALIELAQAGINVAAVVEAQTTTDWAAYPKAMTYTDDNDSMMAFNTSTELGAGYFTAAMEFITRRYSVSADQGLIADYVISNELDQPFSWNKILPGDEVADIDTYMEEYNRTLRIAYTAVRQTSSDADVSVPFTKYWTIKSDGVENSYAAKDLLDWLNARTKEQGDFPWALSPHPYSFSWTRPDVINADSGVAETYDSVMAHKYVTGDFNSSPMISVENCELYQQYLDQPQMRYNGEPREIYFTETAIVSGWNEDSEQGQRYQAGGWAQLYYRMASLPSTRCIIYFQLADDAAPHKVGLFDEQGNYKLMYDVWQHIDTVESFDYSNEYLKDIQFRHINKDGSLGDTVYSFGDEEFQSYRDLMTVVDTGYDWDAVWDEEKLTPVGR